MYTVLKAITFPQHLNYVINFTIREYVVMLDEFVLWLMTITVLRQVTFFNSKIEREKKRKLNVESNNILC